MTPDERRTHGRWTSEYANDTALAPEDAAFREALAGRAAATLASGDVAAIRSYLAGYPRHLRRREGWADAASLWRA